MSSCGAGGPPTASPCGHRCTEGIDWGPPMCLDAQGGIMAKRQPFSGWCCLEVMCLGRGRRDVLSCTFCQMELRILTHLLDWKSCSQALSRHPLYHPGFEVHVRQRSQSLQTFSCRDLQCSIISEGCPWFLSHVALNGNGFTMLGSAAG